MNQQLMRMFLLAFMKYILNKNCFMFNFCAAYNCRYVIAENIGSVCSNL